MKKRPADSVGVRFSRKHRRRLWLQVHLYLGLSAGAVFAVIGLTGSILAFRPELDVRLHPELRRAHPADGSRESREYQPLDDIVSAAQGAIPPDGQAYALVFPHEADTTFFVTYSRPAPNPQQLEWHQVFIDPYRAELTGQRLMLDLERPWRGSFLDFILHIHYALALVRKAQTLLGCSRSCCCSRY